MKRIGLFLLAVFMVAGCASISVTPLSQAYAGKPRNCRLDVYMDEKKITKQYEDLSLISATTGQSFFEDRTINGAINLARPRACECGADAIIVMSTNDTTWTFWNDNGRGNVTVRAIKYKE